MTVTIQPPAMISSEPELILLPFSCDEMAAFRNVGDRSTSFQCLAHAAMRLQVLRTFRSVSLGAGADAGAAKAEDTALAALGACPAPDRQALALKTDLFAAREARDDNLAAMLAAALSADAARLTAQDERRHPASMPAPPSPALSPSAAKRRRFASQRALGPG